MYTVTKSFKIGKAITNRKLKKILVTENEEISISNI